MSEQQIFEIPASTKAKAWIDNNNLFENVSGVCG